MAYERRRPIRKSFADQFEVDGDGFLYRKDGRGPAIRISTDEYRRLVSQFDLLTRISLWGLLPAFLLVLIAMLYLAAAGLDVRLPSRIAPAVLIALSIGIQFWAHYGPARMLRDRRPVAPSLPKADFYRHHLRSMSYAGLVFTVALGPLICLIMSRQVDLWRGWGLVWPALAAAAAAGAVVQAIGKWRLERDERRRRSQGASEL